MTHTEITTDVVHVCDFTGSDWWLAFEEWEQTWENHRYSYLGRCLTQVDSVTFTGDLKQGDCYIVADGEVVFSRSWYTSTSDDTEFLNWWAEQAGERP